MNVSSCSALHTDHSRAAEGDRDSVVNRYLDRHCLMFAEQYLVWRLSDEVTAYSGLAPGQG